jgi:hypothetical protein
VKYFSLKPDPFIKNIKELCLLVDIIYGVHKEKGKFIKHQNDIKQFRSLK